MLNYEDEPLCSCEGILPERLWTAEIGGCNKKKNKIKKPGFGSASCLYLLITLATLQSLWTAHLRFTPLKQGSHRITRGLAFFPFREHTRESHICVLAVLNCSKLSYILHQKSSQSHNNYRLKHTSYPKAVSILWSVIILSICHQTMLLWWSGGLVTHMVTTDLHHVKTLAAVLCSRKLCSRLLRKRAGLVACIGALLVKKRVKRKIESWKYMDHISKPAETSHSSALLMANDGWLLTS